MITTADNANFKVNNFDLLRLLAAIEVVFDHYFQHLNIPLSPFQINLLYLFPGVPVFFIISGYLISASYQRNNNLKNYARNRALRIYPGLWACIAISVIVISVTGVSFFNKQTLAWLPAQLLGFIYTPGFLSNYGFGSYNGSLWTIPIELQFYFAVPVLYLLIPKKYFNQGLVSLLIVFIAANILLQSITLSALIGKLVSYTFLPHFYLFLFGILLQRAQLYNSRYVAGRALPWLAIYLSFCLGAYRFMPSLAFELVRNLLLGIVVLAMAYSWPHLAKKVLRGQDISYGIYIYHGLILTVLVNQGLALEVGWAGLLLLTVTVAELSWLLVERPFIKRKKSTMHKAG